MSTDRQHNTDASLTPQPNDRGGDDQRMTTWCADSAEDDIHPAQPGGSPFCAYHRALRRVLSSTASRERSRAIARGEDPTTIPTPTPTGPRPAHIRATAPAVPLSGDGIDVHITVPRDVLDRARAAFAAEERARDTYGRDTSSREAADGLAAASLALSQAVDPLLFAEGLPD